MLVDKSKVVISETYYFPNMHLGFKIWVDERPATSIKKLVLRTERFVYHGIFTLNMNFSILKALFTASSTCRNPVCM